MKIYELFKFSKNSSWIIKGHFRSSDFTHLPLVLKHLPFICICKSRIRINLSSNWFQLHSGNYNVPYILMSYFFGFKSGWFLVVVFILFFLFTFLGIEKINLFNFVGKLHWWMHSDRKLSWNEKDSCVRVGITILRAFYGAVARETTALSVRVWNGCLLRTRLPDSHCVMLMKWKEWTYFRGLTSN